MRPADPTRADAVRRRFAPRRTTAATLLALLALAALSACDHSGGTASRATPSPSRTPRPDTAAAGTHHEVPGAHRPVTEARGARLPVRVYAHTHPGMLSPAVRNDPARLYVPNSESNTVSVIDPAKRKV